MLVNRFFVYYTQDCAVTATAQSCYNISFSEIKELEFVKLLEDTHELESNVDDYLSLSADKLG